ncbi:MAG: hypothetical protein JWR36_298 [Glaciihabitans sp.]|jgi:hypothetical protein|nr:hypothetical protein [Glaciihabitans sp.]MDQ1570695.1 hypothetical protein [Actinomycetota bacterium]
MTFQAYIDTIKAKTGLDPDDFLVIAREKNLLGDGVKAGPVMAWLKEDYGLGPGHGMALVSVFRDRTQGIPSQADRFEKHFAGAKSVWQLAYDELMKAVMEFGHDISVQPTDTYLSLLRGKGKFAVIAISAKRMDVGLKLQGKEPTDRLALGGNWNTMVTHRVQLFDGVEIDDELVGWLREAYDRAA